MNILSWNVRGINGRTKQSVLCNCIMAEQPYILFLHETKCTGTTAKEIYAWSWRQIRCIFNDSNGVMGGIDILWNPTTITMDCFYSIAWMLTTKYRVIGFNEEGIITNAYGPQSPPEKDNFI
jgi:exonuclease III